MRSREFVQSAAPRHVTAPVGSSLRLIQPDGTQWLFIIPYSLIVLVWLSAATIVFAVLGVVLIDTSEMQIDAIGDSLFLLGSGAQMLALFSMAALRVSYTVLWNLAGRGFIEVGRRYIRLVGVMRGLMGA